MSIALTKRQADCLSFVREYVAEHGYAPSMDEIADALDLGSKSGVVRLLNALEERGHVRRLPNRARSIELIPTTTSFDLTALSDADLRTLADRLDAEVQRRAA